MENDLVIVGSGGMGREVLVLVNRINEIEKKWNFIGFVDKQGEYRIAGDDDWLMGRKEKIFAALAVGSPILRDKLYRKFSSNRNVIFPNLVDPSVIIGDETVTMGKGNIICAGSILTTNVEIGNFNIINLNCTLSHDTVLGNFVTLSMGCNLAGNTLIGDMTDIGTGTRVIQGRRIGNGSVIGAGAAVIHDIGDYVTAVGVPAKVIKERSSQKVVSSDL